MSTWTRVFLVLLRLFIGWHFLVEGIEKVQSLNKWPADSGKAWSSAPYLREATGPLAPYFRRIVGDPDEEAAARFAVAPPDSENPQRADHLRVPPALHKHWDDYVGRFASYYELTAEQRTQAEGVLAQSENTAVRWLLGLKDQDVTVGIKEVEKSGQSVPAYAVKETPLQRIEAYRHNLAELKHMQTVINPEMEKDVFRAELVKKKAEVNKARTELLDDLDDLLRKPLRLILTPNQVHRDSVRFGSQIPKDPIPPAEPPAVLRLADKTVAYGLVACGAGLLLGLFTRLSCLGGAALLLLFYLAMPALPGIPEPLKAEGHYYIINKNLIEMVALLALMTTPSGRWFGCDALIHWIFSSKPEE